MGTMNARDKIAEAHDVEACRNVVRSAMADLGVEVTVSTAPPIIDTPYDSSPMICPHGTTFYLAPTSEQIAKWAADGVA